ncbi:acylphosphatase-2-like isoform X1 [Gopherus flavomarginatus]|uniref:acylphosphatase-2-like isoform X1 n=1 Tax=Gopherus flavomarginatus TaxID=286002 RepID=UPI0021CC2951|nr:acylphosphatase-2-like isoform X1 [Gopherus flavomarginatus]
MLPTPSQSPPPLSGPAIQLPSAAHHTSPCRVMASSGLWALDYEVYGDVQGVFFRKYTEDQGKKLGVVGWVKNTPYGTVTGQVQGPKEKIEIMKNWLRNVGSPMSRIDRAVFSNEREISTLEFPNFTTKY